MLNLRTNPVRAYIFILNKECLLIWKECLFVCCLVAEEAISGASGVLECDHWPVASARRLVQMGSGPGGGAGGPTENYIKKTCIKFYSKRVFLY